VGLSHRKGRQCAVVDRPPYACFGVKPLGARIIIVKAIEAAMATKKFSYYSVNPYPQLELHCSSLYPFVPSSLTIAFRSLGPHS